MLPQARVDLRAARALGPAVAGLSAAPNSCRTLPLGRSSATAENLSQETRMKAGVTVHDFGPRKELCGRQNLAHVFGGRVATARGCMLVHANARQCMRK